MLNADTCYRALESRDRRFEGRFVTAVLTTGIYCRPSCPAPLPRRKNVEFYPCAAAAEDAGFRACLRCRPDTSSMLAGAWGTGATVSRALRLIDGGILSEGGVPLLAQRLGMSERHLRRLFEQHLGTTPLSIERTRRTHFARSLIEQTRLPISEVAFASGFSSLRRFNAAMRGTFHQTPSQLRGRVRASNATEGALELTLPYRPPLDFDALLAFLRVRAIPGVEEVTATGYRRVVGEASAPGVLDVRAGAPGVNALQLRLSGADPRRALEWVRKTRQLFDLDADPSRISAQLGRDALLQPSVRVRPGLRVPGAWNGFELAVRAILGQQVSVAGATSLSGKLVRAFGAPLNATGGALTHTFPSPEQLAEADIARAVGMPGTRAEAIRQLARATVERRVTLDGSLPFDEAMAQLTSLPGIGPWTANYIGMRALREPDAFPTSDLVLLQASGLSVRELERRSERWRPWRAYAAMHLWQLAPGAVRKERSA